MLLQAFATFDVYHFDFRRADNEALGGGRGGRLRRDRGGCRHCIGWGNLQQPQRSFLRRSGSRIRSSTAVREAEPRRGRRGETIVGSTLDWLAVLG
jgi:hypothetical protein